MSNILTSGKDIQLHTFPSLNSKFTFKYVSEPRKFFIFPNDNVIVSMYRDNRIDLLHAYRTNPGQERVKRIKKLKLNGVTCASVLSRDGKYEIAMGLTNGNIEFVDFNTKTMLEKKFSSDVFGNSVENMDFNKDYEILASTFQSGELQLYNMKSFRKLQRYRLDMKSDVVRFHPTNPDLLAVTSLGGALNVLNVNLKRTMYSIAKAHKNYSADIAWLPSSISTLLSVGGTTMKIFDTRQNVTLSVADHAYSYSTLAISPCEKYCCVGDVKGSVLSYDIRNIRTVLQTNNCHDGIVTNLRFLPCPLEAELSTDDVAHEDDSEIDSIERKKPDKRRNSAQIFFDLVAPVKKSVNDSEGDSTSRKKSSTRRTSAQDFFDIVAPIQQKKERTSSGDDVFTRRSAEATKSVSNDLKSVPEENMTTDSSHSNNQTSMDGEVDVVAPTPQYLKNKRHTIHLLVGRELLGSDNVFPSLNGQCSTPQERPISYKSSVQSHISYTAADMNHMAEKLHDMEIRMNEKLSNIQRTLEDKLNEKCEDLNEVIIHGFRSIHCNLWTVAEGDVRETKSMVANMHENYSQIADVFLENRRLKEQLLQLQQQQLLNLQQQQQPSNNPVENDTVNGSPRNDAPMESDSL